MSGGRPRHILVVANETVVGGSLLEALGKRAAQGPIRVTVICPQNAPRAGYVVYQDERRSAAERRLRRTLDLLHEAGARVQGHPHLAAILDRALPAMDGPDWRDVLAAGDEPVLQELDSSIRETETEVFSPSRSNPAERIYLLKRAVLDLHAAIVPLAPATEKLAVAQLALIGSDMPASMA